MHDFYCASMLMLLKPWRSLRLDLKSESESWSEAFESFLQSCSNEWRSLVSGINYLHQCQSAVTNNDICEGTSADHLDDEDDTFNKDNVERVNTTYSEEGLQRVIQMQTLLPEEWHGRMAVELGRCAGIFQEQVSKNENWCISGKQREIRKVSSEDLQNLIVWQKQLTAEVAKMNTPNTNISSFLPSVSPSVSCLENTPNLAEDCLRGLVELVDCHLEDLTLSAIAPSLLKMNKKEHTTSLSGIWINI